ncbi:MAG: methyltransferase [Planctomycetota bacterium]
MAKQWTAEAVQDVARSFQPACVLVAGADLDVFSRLGEKPMTASAFACEIESDPRAATIVLDALVALELLVKQGDDYSVPDDVCRLLSERSADNVLPMIRHLGNCLRRWAQLPVVTQTGRPAERTASVRGAAADQAAFIGAMHKFSGPVAAQVVGRLQPLEFSRLLDIGGASGTWTMAFLQAAPQATAIVFDLPSVIPMARRRIAEAGLGDRVSLVGGDFYTDDLPEGADLAWLGAICHQNSREQNRALFSRIHRALKDGGAVVIRDVVMDPSHTNPPGGALFAVNMLVATDGGGTYTFDEYREDLLAAGFQGAELVHRDEFMNSLIKAKKTLS